MRVQFVGHSVAKGDGFPSWALVSGKTRTKRCNLQPANAQHIGIIAGSTDTVADSEPGETGQRHSADALLSWYFRAQVAMVVIGPAMQRGHKVEFYLSGLYRLKVLLINWKVWKRSPRDPDIVGGTHGPALRFTSTRLTRHHTILKAGGMVKSWAAIS